MQWLMDILQLVVAGVILAVFIYVQFFSTTEKRGPLPRNAPADSVTRRIDRREIVRGDRRVNNQGPPAGVPERRAGPRRGAEGAARHAVPVRPLAPPPPARTAAVAPAQSAQPAAAAPLALRPVTPPRSIADLYVQTATIAPAHTYTDRRQKSERRVNPQETPHDAAEERRQGPRREQDKVNLTADPGGSETDSSELRKRLFDKVRSGNWIGDSSKARNA